MRDTWNVHETIHRALFVLNNLLKRIMSMSTAPIVPADMAFTPGLTDGLFSVLIHDSTCIMDRHRHTANEIYAIIVNIVPIIQS
ncbi:MAG TPA: hypothetical protein DDX85_00690 [Nitrospiraceae bacterium]|nr:hypothetical protein [Nitrospiraceae bacterium]